MSSLAGTGAASKSGRLRNTGRNNDESVQAASMLSDSLEQQQQSGRKQQNQVELGNTTG